MRLAYARKLPALADIPGWDAGTAMTGQPTNNTQSTLSITKYVCRAPAADTSVCLVDSSMEFPCTPIVAPSAAPRSCHRRTCGPLQRNSLRIVDSVVTGA